MTHNILYMLALSQNLDVLLHQICNNNKLWTQFHLKISNSVKNLATPCENSFHVIQSEDVDTTSSVYLNASSEIGINFSKRIHKGDSR